jgi:hypothetical protein
LPAPFGNEQRRECSYFDREVHPGECSDLAECLMQGGNLDGPRPARPVRKWCRRIGHIVRLLADIDAADLERCRSVLGAIQQRLDGVVAARVAAVPPPGSPPERVR